MNEERRTVGKIGAVGFDLHAGYAEDVGVPFVAVTMLQREEADDDAEPEVLHEFVLGHADADELGTVFMRMAAGATFMGRIAIFTAICEERGDESSAQTMREFQRWFLQGDAEVIDRTAETLARMALAQSGPQGL